MLFKNKDKKYNKLIEELKEFEYLIKYKVKGCVGKVQSNNNPIEESNIKIVEVKVSVNDFLNRKWWKR